MSNFAFSLASETESFISIVRKRLNLSHMSQLPIHVKNYVYLSYHEQNNQLDCVSHRLYEKAY